VALLTFYIHSFFEWILFTFQVQYVMAISIGIVAGTAVQLNYWRPAARNFGVRVDHLAGQRPE
jgi:hypothetical protein